MPELPTDAATILAIERAVIGGVLANHGFTIPSLHVQEFFKDGHRLIWAALLNVATTHGSVEISSLAQYLAGRDELGEIGGWEALAQIENEGALVTSANLPGYASQVRESYRKREEARIGRLLNAGEIRGDEARRLLAELPELRSNGNGSSLVYRRLDSIAEQPVVWQWEKYVAAGMVNLVAGEPDIGKSLLLADMAARLTSGRPWPDGAPGAPVGTVMFLSAEDGAANTLRPRIRVAGGDLSRV
ncbi:MAG TPA: AAA family ATPase, partial [Burkholderiales bacterium]|nr:AAA family ATPase [Burkholderiales bacterium]